MSTASFRHALPGLIRALQRLLDEASHDASVARDHSDSGDYMEATQSLALTDTTLGDAIAIQNAILWMSPAKSATTGGASQFEFQETSHD